MSKVVAEPGELLDSLVGAEAEELEAALAAVVARLTPENVCSSHVALLPTITYVLKNPDEFFNYEDVARIACALLDPDSQGITSNEAIQELFEEQQQKMGEYLGVEIPRVTVVPIPDLWNKHLMGSAGFISEHPVVTMAHSVALNMARRGYSETFIHETLHTLQEQNYDGDEPETEGALKEASTDLLMRQIVRHILGDKTGEYEGMPEIDGYSTQEAYLAAGQKLAELSGWESRAFAKEFAFTPGKRQKWLVETAGLENADVDKILATAMTEEARQEDLSQDAVQLVSNA